MNHARIKSSPQTAMELAFNRAVQAAATKKPKPTAQQPSAHTLTLKPKEPRRGNP